MKSSALLSTTEPGTVGLGEAVPAVGDGIVSRALLATAELRVVVFSFAPGQALTEHTNPARAVIQILTGECEFSVAGQPRPMRAGDLLHLPPRVPHAVTASTAMTMLLTLAPERTPAA